LTAFPKIAFSTFADGNIGARAAGRRLIKQAHYSNVFKLGALLEDLESIYEGDQHFKNRNQGFIASNKHGLGNYIWKPKILINLLNRVKTNEFVCYLDAGCQLNLNPDSLDKFAEYFDTADSFGGLFMQLENGTFGAPDLSDEAWTNKKTLDYLDPTSKNRKTGQIQAGILLMKKNSLTTGFAEQWLKTCESENYTYLREDPTNLISGRHRYDQSIFSLLVKESGMKFIPDETYWAPNWSQGLNYPIWAMRNRSGGDAYRRNFVDLSKIGIARIARIARI
jgi:hypothetical protein